MTQDLTTFIAEKEILITNKLIDAVSTLSVPDRLKASMLYSIKAGGKRIRPLLMLASCEAYRGNYHQIENAALALELVHTYSLIHDDLPAMDNDDIRRGQPTNHRAFDEATAILAGDALLTYSFELIATDENLADSQKIYLINQLAKASGPQGMIAGQSLDMEAENMELNLDALENIHDLKTGRLLQFALDAGAFIGGANGNQQQAMREFGYYLGLLFQLQDDILDVTGDPTKIGKPVGSDEVNLKSTYPKLLGLEDAIKTKQQYIQYANEALSKTNANIALLQQFVTYISNRNA